MVWGAPVAGEVVSEFNVGRVKPTLTVLAGNGSKIEDVKLAALCDSAAAKGRVGLGHDDRSAGNESEDGGGELHGEYRSVDSGPLVKSELIDEDEEKEHTDLEGNTYSLLFKAH
jgi:hypothetical protein